MQNNEAPPCLQYIIDIINAGLTKECHDLFWEIKSLPEDVEPSLKDSIHNSIITFRKCCSFEIKTTKRSAYLQSILIKSPEQNGISNFFTEEERGILRDIARNIEESSVQARIYDVLWEASKKYEVYEEARNYYLDAAKNQNYLPSYRIAYIDRLIYLATQQGKQERDKLLIEISNFFTNAKLEEFQTLLHIPDLLIKYGFKQHSHNVAGKLEKIAERISQQKDYDLASSVYENLSVWYKSNNQEAYGKALLNAANNKIRFGKTRPVTILYSELENAISLLEQIPNSVKNVLNINEKIKDLLEEKEQVKKRLSNNTMPYSIEVEENKDVQKQVLAAISSKNFNSTMNYLLYEIEYLNISRIKEAAKESEKDAPLLSNIPAVIYSSDNRHVANIESKEQPDWGEDKYNMQLLMIHYNYNIIWTSCNILLPVISHIKEKCMPSENDVLAFIKTLSAIPNGRLRLISKGVYYALSGNFLVAMHILAPQYENFIRLITKNLGEQTSYVDINTHCETENALGKIIENINVKRILGKDIYFETKYLFCSELFANIRNNIAHGLVDDYDFVRSEYIYSFWFVLKFFACFSSSNPDLRFG